MCLFKSKFHKRLQARELGQATSSSLVTSKKLNVLDYNTLFNTRNNVRKENKWNKPSKSGCKIYKQRVIMALLQYMVLAQTIELEAWYLKLQGKLDNYKQSESKYRIASYSFRPWIFSSLDLWPYVLWPLDFQIKKQ